MHDNNTYNLTGRDQFFPQAETGPPSQLSSSLSFNDAPIHLLSPYFTAREDELDHIGKILSMSYGSAPARCAIYGMQGLGTTQLALQYAVMSYNQQRYSFIFWISGATVEKVNQGIIKILTLVGHPDRHHPAQTTRLTSARRFLEEPDLNGPIKWLLILDNVNSEAVDFINEYLPQKNSSGDILFTTRTAAVAEALTRVEGQHQTFELRAPDAKDAANLLLVEAGIDTSNTVSSTMTRAKELVKCIGCLFLAVSLAASFLKQFDKSLDDLLGLYRSEHDSEINNDLSDYGRMSIAITFAIQFAELERQAPDVSNLLKIISFYDAENIPLEMIVEGAESQSYPTDLVERLKPESQIAECATAQVDTMGDQLILYPNLKALISSPVQLHQAIQQLQRLSLVGAKSNTDTSSLHIHELIQYMVREKAREDTQHHWFRVAVMLACRAFQHIEDPQLPECWVKCEMFIPHIQSLTTWDDKHAIGSSELDQVNTGVVKYLTSRGRYGEAEALCVRVLARNEQLLGVEHPETLRTVETLAASYQMRGRYGEAEILHGRVLAGRENLLGPEHLDTLRTVENLAAIYRLQVRYSDAETLCDRALAGREKLLGPDHSDTLRAVENLAVNYLLQSRYGEAETLFDRKLIGREKLFGSEHPDTLRTVEAIAVSHQMQGRYGEAETLYGRVLAGREKLLGSEHPDTLHTVDKLAVNYLSQGRYGEAETLLFDRVLAGRERVLGSEHPDTLRTAETLAVTHQLQGRYGEAETLYGRVLAGREKLLGSEHPDTLHTIEKLANSFQSQGQYSEAETLYNQALVGREKLLGSDHPDTLRTVENLGVNYLSQSRYDEAETLLNRVLAGRQKLLGSEHPDTLHTVETLAVSHQMQGRYGVAETMYGRVLAGREKLLGSEHPDTLHTVDKLAVNYRSQGRYSEAETLCDRALAGKTKLLGLEHPDTLHTIENLAANHQSQGRYREAEMLYGRVLGSREELLGSEHPDTLRTVKNLVVNYQSQGRDKEAEILYGRVLAYRENSLVSDHPITLQTVEHFVVNYQS